MKRLYQKHHGLPGIPQISGRNGKDGDGGNNIYFGFVSDFFNNMEMTVDNFIRIARRGDGSHGYSEKGSYYTGIFSISDTGNDYTDQDNYTGNEKYEEVDKGFNEWGDKVEETTRTYDSDMNIFKYIYSDIHNKPYYDIYDYSYREGGSNPMSWLYIKVDTNNVGSPKPWNTSTNVDYWDWIIYDKDDKKESYAYPYSDYSGNIESVDKDFRPGKSLISNIDGFELFSIVSNNKRYTYSTDNDHFDDKRYDGYTNDNYSDPLVHPYDENKSMIDYFSDLYISGAETGVPFDYVKYSKKAVETVLFTDKLNPDIKAGDIIYFYTDKDSFELEHIVDYMVVITKELENCTLTELLAHATITEPFSFKYTSTKQLSSDDYVITNNSVVSVRYGEKSDDVSSAPEKVKENGNNFANMVSYSSNSGLIIGRLISKIGTETESDMFFCRASTGKIFKFMSSYKDNEVTVNKIVSSNNGSKIPLKISNMMIRKNNIGNVEAASVVMSDKIILDSYGYCHTLMEDNYNYSKNAFIVNSTDIINDENYTDYTYGATVISYDNLEIDDNVYKDKENSTITHYILDSENNSITLSEIYNENTTHNIVLWVSDSCGIKHYSKHTIAKYDTEIMNYNISVLEDSEIEVDDSQNSDYTIFMCSGLSSDESDNELNIFVKGTPNITVFANTHELSSSYNYSNSWCKLSDFKKVSYNDRTDEYKHSAYNKDDGYDMYTVKVHVNDNIPQIIDSDVTKAKDYNRSAGTSNETDGCDLFNALMKGSTIKTNDRSVTITVKYMSGSKQIKDYYKLVQPGYIDNRKIPKVKLEIKNDLDTLERSNDINNGVLCNQFQFFVDIEISDFSRDYWGSYVPEEDITLNFDIVNTPVDYEFVERYGVQSAENMYTVHVNPVDSSTDFTNNYCAIKTYLIDNELVDPYTKPVSELVESDVKARTKLTKTVNGSEIKTSVTDKIRTSDTEDNTPIQLGDIDYTSMNERIFKGDTATRGSGIDDNLLIQMRNITFEQANSGKFRFLVTVELTNPLFSRLFFRYYISNLWVSYRYDYDSDKSDEKLYDVEKFYIGTSNLARASQTGRYQTYEYMFATDTFNAFVCPITFTAVPNEDSVDRIDINVKNVGSEKQISLKMDTYVPELSPIIQNMSDTQRLTYIVQNQYIPWYDFKLKKRYLQDNIKNIYVQPIHISDIKDKISSKNMFNIIDGYDAIKSSRIANSYMSVVYNANMYNSRMREDYMTFYYNDELYIASKYSQYGNNAPVFVSEDLSYDVRDSVLMSSIDTWNYEYQTTNSYNDNTFSGHLSTYGNGYQYLDKSRDKGQYEDILSLEETIKQNEVLFFSEPYIDVCAQLAKNGMKYPDKNGWFRQLLYQLKWQYPRYYTDDNQNEKIDAYDIVDGGTYLQTYNKDGKLPEYKYKLPHNIMYSIYPRCAYDDETDTTIVFMLRCPSVDSENKYKLESSDVKFTHIEDDYNSSQLGNSGLNIAD